MSWGHRLLWNERRPRAGLDGSSPRAGPLMPEPVRSWLPWWCFSDTAIQQRIKGRTHLCPCSTPSSRARALNSDASFIGWEKWINASMTPLSPWEMEPERVKPSLGYQVNGKPLCTKKYLKQTTQWQLSYKSLGSKPTWHRHQISHFTYPILSHCYPFQTAPSSFRLPRIKFMSPYSLLLFGPSWVLFKTYFQKLWDLVISGYHADVLDPATTRLSG